MLGGFFFGIKSALIIICFCVAITIAVVLPVFVILLIYLIPYMWNTPNTKFVSISSELKAATKLYKSWIFKKPAQ